MTPNMDSPTSSAASGVVEELNATRLALDDLVNHPSSSDEPIAVQNYRHRIYPTLVKHLRASRQAATLIETLQAERDEARARQREVFERGAKIDGKDASPVWLERSVGANFLWLVWAVKPGQVRLVAVCSDEATADRYAYNLPPGLADFKPWKERAPIDHSFGFADSMHARIQGAL